MTDKEKIQALKSYFDDTIWMAIRYAHGRHSYAPGMVRDAITKFKEIFPDWEPKEDKTLEKPDESKFGGVISKSDYLNDLTEK